MTVYKHPFNFFYETSVHYFLIQIVSSLIVECFFLSSTRKLAGEASVDQALCVLSVNVHFILKCYGFHVQLEEST